MCLATDRGASGRPTTTSMSTPDRYWRALCVAVMSSTCSPGCRRCSEGRAGTADSRAKACGQARRSVPALASRLPAAPRGQRRARVPGGEGLRPGQANRAGPGGARLRIDPTECRLDVLGDRQELTPGGVELPTVGGGHEHALAIGLLERGDASRDGRVIEAEAVGGGRELPQTSDGEQSQQILRGDLLTGSAWCI